MSILAQLLGTYAPGHVLTHEGSDFVFSRIDKAAKAALQIDYFKRAREAVYAIKGEVTAEEFDRQLSHVTDSYRRGLYAFPAGESYGYYLSPEGLPALVARLTGRTLADAEALVEERTVEVMHVCLCVVMESFPDLKKKALAMAPEDSPHLLALAKLLSPTTSSNGSSSPKPTSAPRSPSWASGHTSTPG